MGFAVFLLFFSTFIWLLFFVYLKIRCFLFKPKNNSQFYGQRKPVPRVSVVAPKKPQWVTNRIVYFKAVHPDYSCRAIADLFNRLYLVPHKMYVSKSFVHNTIRKYKYEIQILRRKIKNKKPKPVPINYCWGIDLTFKTDNKGNSHAIIGIVEHACRANLALKNLSDKSSISILRVILSAIEIYGKPENIRTDNEAVFTSKTFRFALKFLKINHQLIDKACPWQNGRIERFFGTLKKHLNQWSVSDINQLSDSLRIFRFFYNHVRPHQNLNHHTPAEVAAGIGKFSKNPKKRIFFKAWDGLLCGYYFPS